VPNRGREQVFVRTGIAADASEPVFEHAAGEELLRHPRDDGTPRAIRAREALVVDRLQAVQMIRHEPKERRRLRTAGFVDATRRRCRVGHARSGTAELSIRPTQLQTVTVSLRDRLFRRNVREARA
jgi:hypothetical protein